MQLSPDSIMLRSRHTHLNAAIVSRELRRDMAPTALRFAIVLAGLAGLVLGMGAV